MKTEAMREYVLSAYLATGRHVCVIDVAKEFNTNALGVRRALGYDDFIFEHADRWTGSNYAGRYTLAPCVEPNKTYLAKIINSLRGTQ